jgi:hypothetical protein
MICLWHNFVGLHFAGRSGCGSGDFRRRPGAAIGALHGCLRSAAVGEVTKEVELSREQAATT